MTTEKLIYDIEKRIEDEYKKHNLIDWKRIAAVKIFNYLKENKIWQK